MAMVNTVCKFNKYSGNCNFVHEDKKCDADLCDVRVRPYRHPNSCRYIQNNKSYKYMKICAFEHDLVNVRARLPAYVGKDSVGQKLMNLKK